MDTGIAERMAILQEKIVRLKSRKTAGEKLTDFEEWLLDDYKGELKAIAEAERKYSHPHFRNPWHVCGDFCPYRIDNKYQK